MAQIEGNVESEMYEHIGGYDIVVKKLKDGRTVATINDVAVDPNAIGSVQKRIHTLVEQAIKLYAPISYKDIVKYVDSELAHLDLSRDESMIAPAYRSGINVTVSSILYELEYDDKKITYDIIQEESDDHVALISKFRML